MPTRAPDYPPGQAIPGTVYRVHRVLGAGGMGTVYDVEDTSVGKRYVLKTLHGDLADRADLAARLAREARALAKLQHPNIVEVYTSGTTQDSLRLPYYVMERLQGQSLRTVLERKGRLTIEQACDIGIDLLDALDHAHEFGIIHRDVKPDNIFITRGRDGRSLAKLLDFGIIKLAAGPSSQTMQTGGRFIGTFRYAPPEQILGREVTPRSDLYAAGLVIYEMISGRGPFDDFTGEMEIGKAHIDVTPPPLSRFAQVNHAIEQLVMSSLQKDPAIRPRDAFTFASSLRDLKKQLATKQAFSRSQAATVDQVVEQPFSAARPARPFGSSAMTNEDAMRPPSSGPTRVDGPAAMNAPTAAAVDSMPVRTSTLSLGIAPVVAQAAPVSQPPSSFQATYAAAPLDVTTGSAQPLASAPPMPIDRRAETREAAPQMAQRPNYDTAPIPLVMAPRPDSIAQGNGTFGPHTTEASQRKKSARSALVAVIAAGAIVSVIGIAAIVVWKQRHSTATAATPPTASQTVAHVQPVVTLPVESTSAVVANTTTATTQTQAPVPPPTQTQTQTQAQTQAPAPTHTHTQQVQTVAPSPMHTAPPSTTTAPTASHKTHVGSGL